MFKKRENVADIEEGNLLSPKFDNDGLIPVITTCSKTKEILMHGYMNVEALKLTIETKEAHYWSRSRKAIWHKGKTSGFTQKVKEIRMRYGLLLILVMELVVMLAIDLASIDRFQWEKLRMVEKWK